MRKALETEEDEDGVIMRNQDSWTSPDTAWERPGGKSQARSNLILAHKHHLSL